MGNHDAPRAGAQGRSRAGLLQSARVSSRTLFAEYPRVYAAINTVALEDGCDVLETRDGKLSRNNGIEGLTIREPFWEAQTETTDEKV